MKKPINMTPKTTGGYTDKVKLKENQIPAKLSEPKFVFEDKVPSNWTLVPIDENRISAVNVRTGQKFEGTMVEFNKALRE